MSVFYRIFLYLLGGESVDEYKHINKYSDILNRIINKKDYLTIRITSLPEILKIIENCKSCTNCKDKIKGNYFDSKSIKEIESLLSKLEEEKEERKKDDIVDILNEKILCESCKKEMDFVKLINEYSDILEMIINKNNKKDYLTVKIASLPEVLKIIKNCISCKYKIK